MAKNIFRVSAVLTIIGLVSITNHAWAHTPTKSSPHSITQFVQQLWSSNPQIQSLQAEVDKAKANASASGKPLYNPSIKFSGQHVHKEPLENTYTAGISQTVDWAGKRTARKQVGQANLTATQALLANTKLTVAIQALQSLADYQTQKAIVHTVQKQTLLLKRFDEQAHKRFKAGDIARDEVNQANLAYANILGQLGEARAQLSQSEQKLEALTNQTVRHWPNLPTHLPNVQKPNTTQKALWLKQLPIMQSLTARVISAQAGIRVAQTNAKPDPTVSVTGGEEDHKALVAANVSIPLFIRNNYQAQIVAAGANLTAIEQMRINQYREAKAALSGSLKRYAVLRKAYAQWDQISRPSLSKGIILLNRLWRAGELNTTNYLVQLKQRLDSQITGHRLLGNAWHAWFEELQASDQLTSWLHHRYKA